MTEIPRRPFFIASVGDHFGDLLETCRKIFAPEINVAPISVLSRCFFISLLKVKYPESTICHWNVDEPQFNYKLVQREEIIGINKNIAANINYIHGSFSKLSIFWVFNVSQWEIWKIKKRNKNKNTINKQIYALSQMPCVLQQESNVTEVPHSFPCQYILTSLHILLKSFTFHGSRNVLYVNSSRNIEKLIIPGNHFLWFLLKLVNANICLFYQKWNSVK